MSRNTIDIASLVTSSSSPVTATSMSADQFSAAFMKRVEEEREAEASRKRARTKKRINNSTAILLVMVAVMWVYTNSEVRMGLSSEEADVQGASMVRQYMADNPKATISDIQREGEIIRNTLMTTTFTIAGVNVGSVLDMYNNLRAIYPEQMDFFVGKVKQLMNATNALANMPGNLFNLITSLAEGKIDIYQMAKCGADALVCIIFYIVTKVTMGTVGAVANIGSSLGNAFGSMSRGPTFTAEPEINNVNALTMSINTQEGTKIVSMADVINFINSRPTPIVNSFFDSMLEFFFEHEDQLAVAEDTMYRSASVSTASTVSSIKSAISEGFFERGQGDIGTMTKMFGLVTSNIMTGMTLLFSGIVKLVDVDAIQNHHETYFRIDALDSCEIMSEVSDKEDRVALGAGVSGLAASMGKSMKLPECLQSLLQYGTPQSSYEDQIDDLNYDSMGGRSRSFGSRSFGRSSLKKRRSSKKKQSKNKRTKNKKTKKLRKRAIKSNYKKG